MVRNLKQLVLVLVLDLDLAHSTALAMGCRILATGSRA
jgi:hypothetical protein